VFVALFVVVSLTTTSSRGPAPLITSSGHVTTVGEATRSAAITTATAPFRRVLALDSHIGAIIESQSPAGTPAVWVVVGLSFELLLLGAGLSRRGRAPPLVRA
jgi:hypothetical protein